MILYFSGTGNSTYVAKRIAKALNQESYDVFEAIKNKKNDTFVSNEAWIVVVPTYAWRIPRIVEKWLEETTLKGNRTMYFVMTCGASIGNAGKYAELLCQRKGLEYGGCKGIVMPENYIALFSTPTASQALRIIDRAEKVIDETIVYLQKGENFPKNNISFMDKCGSGVVNGLFYSLFVHARKFYATKDCISCSKCVEVCPLHNVSLKAGKPVWGKHCTHCMACINYCPKQAIEYGRSSRGRSRYTCPK